ncbi:hypothetical protein H0H81_004747 [Sphagnurus paluster]|uniref:Protein kinase domain-containing protein n=1 Tax=Sphagnurus paluster TaxID=117069 RepID=A0A9P7GKX1_9AGAR|nr:hypothetical protein H0H81_004747 [Sphagnurus paluster]
MRHDACTYNLMMDGSKIIPSGFDFVYPLPIVKGLYEKFSWHTRRSVGPNKYYLIDFGLSRYYPEGVDVEYQIGAIGQDRSVPEFALPLNPYPYNPFKLDIYQLGNSFRKLSAV